MALPNIFAAQTTPNLLELDQNFAALGLLTPIPCSVSGTNTLVLTPLTNTPTVPAYQNYSPFTCIAAQTNTGAATAQVGSLAALGIYADSASGPIALTGGEIPQNNLISLTYDSTLAAGSGGFHLRAVGTGAVSQIIAGTGLTGGTITGSGTIAIATTGVTGATYGSGTSIPVITFNARGQATAVTTASVTFPWARYLTGSGSLTFGLIAGGGSSDQTISVSGCAVNDKVILGPPAVVTAGIVFAAWVSAAGTVTVRAANITAGNITPAVATYSVITIG